MKVTHNPTSPASVSVDSTKASEKSEKAKATGSRADTPHTGAPASAREAVQISEDARLMQRANELAHAAPDRRADKVAALRQAIQSGTYRVDAREIADRLVDEHLKDFTKNPT